MILLTAQKCKFRLLLTKDSNHPCYYCNHFLNYEVAQGKCSSELCDSAKDVLSKVLIHLTKQVSQYHVRKHFCTTQ